MANSRAGSPSDEPASERRPTLADVARKAGVSTASASYALNGQPGVGEESRRRVLQAARQLGFRPNRLARALRQGQTKVLGLLLADIANPFYPELASAVVTEAATKGYEVFLSHSGSDREPHQSLAVNALRDHRCDGFVFTSVTEADRPLLTDLIATGVPIVQAVRRLEGLAADFVGIEDEAAGYDIARHVLSTGRRLPAILGGPRASSASRDRYKGYLRALDEFGTELLHPDLVDGDLTRESGRARAEAILADRSGSLPDVLICGNDMIALGAIDALLEAGLRVPRDMAVVGYDDMSFASSALIGLSTVHVPRAELGRTAVRMLLQRIENPDALPQSVILPHRVVARRTCGATNRRPANHIARQG